MFAGGGGRVDGVVSGQAPAGQGSIVGCAGFCRDREQEVSPTTAMHQVCDCFTVFAAAALRRDEYGGGVAQSGPGQLKLPACSPS